MRRVAIPIVLLVLTGVVVGAEILKDQASANPNPNNPSFFVSNDAAHPVPVRHQGTVSVTSIDDTARSAFAFFRNDSFRSNEDGHVVSFTVPAGKRLVIQAVSINGLVDTGTGQKIVSTAVQARVNGQLEDYIMPPTFTGTTSGGRDVYTVSQPTTIFADGGTDVDLFAVRNVTTGGAIMNASVQGYLIDCTVAACN
jgi:hypothetical protein